MSSNVNSSWYGARFSFKDIQVTSPSYPWKVDWTARFEPWATICEGGNEAVCNLCVSSTFRCAALEMTYHLKRFHVMKLYKKVHEPTFIPQNETEEKVIQIVFKELLAPKTDFAALSVNDFYDWKKSAMAVNGFVLFSLLQKHTIFLLKKPRMRIKIDFSPWIVMKTLESKFYCVACPRLSWSISEYSLAKLHLKTVHFPILYLNRSERSLYSQFNPEDQKLLKAALKRLWVNVRDIARISIKKIYIWKLSLSEKELDLVTKCFLQQNNPEIPIMSFEDAPINLVEKASTESMKEDPMVELFPGMRYHYPSLLDYALEGIEKESSQRSLDNSGKKVDRQ